MHVQVSAAVRSELTKRAAEFSILIDDVAITHLSFGAEVRRPPSCGWELPEPLRARPAMAAEYLRRPVCRWPPAGR